MSRFIKMAKKIACDCGCQENEIPQANPTSSLIEGDKIIVSFDYYSRAGELDFTKKKDYEYVGDANGVHVIANHCGSVFNIDGEPEVDYLGNKNINIGYIEQEDGSYALY